MGRLSVRPSRRFLLVCWILTEAVTYQCDDGHQEHLVRELGGGELSPFLSETLSCQLTCYVLW